MKLTSHTLLIFFIFCGFSCGYMNEVSMYEPSKSFSAYEQFPYKKLFTSSKENGLWGVKNNNCKQVSFSNTNSYIGNDNLHIKWDAIKM